MPLTPEDFEDREFLITLRGYDRDEVQAFLEEAARDYRAAVKAASQARIQADPYEAVGRDVTGILQAANEAASKIIAEAERIKTGAEQEAAGVRERVEQEIASLKESTAAAARQVKQEADKYATAVRERAESDIATLKESTASAARKVKEEAERYAAEVRARAENTAAERDRLLKSARDEAERHAAEVKERAEAAARSLESEARDRIAQLTRTESELKQRLADLQSSLSGVLSAAGIGAAPARTSPEPNGAAQVTPDAKEAPTQSPSGTGGTPTEAPVAAEERPRADEGTRLFPAVTSAPTGEGERRRVTPAADVGESKND